MEIKTIGRTELAQMYLPTLTAKAAWRRVKEWMKKHPATRELAKKVERTFTPAEVEIIFDALGEP